MLVVVALAGSDEGNTQGGNAPSIAGTQALEAKLMNVGGVEVRGLSIELKPCTPDSDPLI